MNQTTNAFRYYRVQLLIVLFLLCILCGNSSAQEFKTVHPGVEYAQVTHKLGNDPVKINLLRLDLKKVRLDVHHAFDKAIGVDTTSAIATSHGAVAAINAGFFRKDTTEFTGDAAGVLVINGNLLSESHQDRIAVRFRNSDRRTETWFDHLTSQTTISDVVDGRLNVTSVTGVNRQRSAADVIAYTPEFGERTMTDSLGVEIVFRDCTSKRGCKIGTIANGGNSVIPKEGFVMSVGPSAVESVSALLDRLKKADAGKASVRLQSEFGPPQFKLTGADDITNGVSQLIKSGKIDITWEKEKAAKSFAETRHPRTAVAKLNDGRFLMITVDGRQPGVSVGMTLQELAEYFLSLGATDAINLDGGGSTTMFLDGKVVNTPSDKEGERKVSDAIVVTLRKR